MAIVFAHTPVDAPKAGAIRRAAAISAPSVEMPATKTTPSGKPHGSLRVATAGATGTIPGMPETGRTAPRSPWPGSRSSAALRRVGDDRGVDQPLDRRA